MSYSITYVRPSNSTYALKRVLDVVASVSGLVLLSPLLALIAVAVKLDSKGPVLFRQKRVGRNGKLFHILKFRSMVPAASKLGTALTVGDDPRITRLGAFLRRTKIDELPQLINVARGEMSLVGPRPEVPQFMKFYSPEQQAIILSLRPGITDYASLLFRDESTLLKGCADPIEVYREEIMPVKFHHYQRYSREISLRADLAIIAGTISVLLCNRVPESLAIGEHPSSESRLRAAEQEVTP